MRLGDRRMSLPCGGTPKPPAIIGITGLDEELQEFGLNVRGRVLHKGSISVYALLLPTGGVLESGEGTAELDPGSYLVITSGPSWLRIEGDLMELP